MSKKEEFRDKWHCVTETRAREITTCTENPGTVFAYDTENLPSNLQMMPGLKSAYVSGAVTSFSVNTDIEVVGELVVAREDGDVGKGYNFVFGVSNDGNVYYNGPYKYFSGHHFSVEDGIPVENLFGHIPYPEAKDD